MDEQRGEQGKKRAAHRSPNYPAFDLQTALEKARRVYEKDKRTPTTPEVIVGHLGYKHADGPGGRALSGLRQYGLLEKAGTNWKVSEAAFKLLHLPESSAERAALMRAAAQAPTLYRQLIEQYPEGLPSEETLRANLVGRGFNPESIGSIIGDLRSTVSFAKLYDVPQIDGQEESMPDFQPVEVRQPKSGRNAPPTLKEYVYAFAGNGGARLAVSGEYTREDLDDLKTLLDTTLSGLRRSLLKGEAPE